MATSFLYFQEIASHCIGNIPLLVLTQNDSDFLRTSNVVFRKMAVPRRSRRLKKPSAPYKPQIDFLLSKTTK